MTQSEGKTFRIVTLGCRANQYESQAYRDQLESAGYLAASEGAKADLCIVNTCTVTSAADSDSRHAVRRLIRQHPGAEVVVTGCAADNHPDHFRAIEGVTQVVPNKDKEQLLASLYPEEQFPEFSIKHFDAHTRAFVKVQDGCNSFCSYCIIPYVRGRSRSRDLPSIVHEVEELVANGYKEVVLTGINIGDFDGGNPEEPKSLSDLVRAVDQVPGLERLRLSSIYPDQVTDELMNTILNGRATCHSLHLVLQSGSNVVLKRMNRHYTRQIYLQTIERLRAASPDFTATTDILVGFPGETDEDFAETLDLVKEVQFAKVHIFPYSRRDRTRAALMPNQLPAPLIAERKQVLMRAAEQAAYALRERYLGRVMSVLTEGLDGEMLSGHTDNFLTVRLLAAGHNANQLIDVRFVENSAEGLIGQIEGLQCAL